MMGMIFLISYKNAYGGFFLSSDYFSTLSDDLFPFYKIRGGPFFFMPHPSFRNTRFAA
ncbi:hypothetical protein PEDI_48540 [Persicobacter diffluens]|uniref:Uncharacterized protein n=1 Tax=Persicobacter diffluens TaxID=981 RepID=A0AAN5AMZ5_9BACT|nr:hypothetical protein PEDI_48540 [Persicobacter diffluens]